MKSAAANVAVTGLALIAIAIVLALLFGSRGYDATSARTSAAVTAAQTWATNCKSAGATLSVDFNDATKDVSQIRQRIAQILSQRETACTQAEAMLTTAIDTHPSNEAELVHLKQEIDQYQEWLRRVSQAFAAYENSNGGATELAALAALIH